jgi:hypothetical protein
VQIVSVASLAHQVHRFGTTGVTISPVAHLTRCTIASVVLAEFGAGGSLGRHETLTWQLFTPVEGSGWVSGEDDERTPIERGWAALWSPGEVHASGSDVGMVACIVESDIRPLAEPRPEG